MFIKDNIDSQLNTFSKTEKQLAKYIRKTPDIIYKTINEVIEESKVGYGSVIRFCKKLDCSGFQDFKIRMASEGNQSSEKYNDNNPNLIDLLHKQTMMQLSITMRNINEHELVSIGSCIVSANKILVIGVAGSFPMAQEFTYRLLRLGFSNTIIESDEHMQAFRASQLGPKDILIVFSYSGATKGILGAAKLAKKNKTPIIAFTNFLKSSLIDLSNKHIVAAIHIPANEAEIGTRIPFYFIIEALTVLILNQSSKSKKALITSYNAVADKQI